MSRLRPYPVAALAAWTLFTWLGRLDLADGLELPIVVFVTLGVVLAVVVLTGRATSGGGRLVVRAASLWTIGYWLVRTPMILAHDHPAGFKVVHFVLAAISVGLALAAHAATARPSTPAIRSATAAGSRTTAGQGNRSTR